jgi:hypothetical protein
MFKVLRPIKDNYIQNRVINGVSAVSGNVGMAGSLDLFKLYGYTSTLIGTSSIPNVELSRLLVQFDLQPLRDAVAAGQVDPGNASFSCHLRLYDVYGGQPTPDHFNVIVYPLSASFDEGHGRDVVFYSDHDVANWFSSSLASGSWIGPGCSSGSGYPLVCDYFTGSGAPVQTFIKGTEDLDVDVTQIVSATLAGNLPDAGFRVSFTAAIEADTHSYFVKRFGSRQAFNHEKRPMLFVRFDDSIQDDTQNFYLDSPSYLFLYNYVRADTLGNLVSGSTQVTGSNCLRLLLQTPVSGAIYSASFTGSQLFFGNNPQTGIYSASVQLSSQNPNLFPQWQASGSITFTPVWVSLDGTLPYLTGSAIKAFPPLRGPSTQLDKKLNVSVYNLVDEYTNDQTPVLRVNLWDFTQPFLLNAVRLPVELPGVIIRDVHYSVRDNDNGHVAIPFDTVTNSTRLSNDMQNMFFTLDTSNLVPGHSYVIDILVVTANSKQVYRNASATFRVVVGE